MMAGFTLQMQARLVRRELRRVRQMWRYQRFSLEDLPVLFANSFPKSGTHLLTQILQGFTRLGGAVDSGLPAIVTFEGETGRQRPVAEILADLNRLRPGDIAYGHLHALPAILAWSCQDGVAPFFILRDPRDVVVSHVHYVTRMAPEHAHHQYYTQVLHSFEERLHASIAGRPDWADLFPDIRARFEPYLSWIDRPEALTVRFEELVADRETAIGRILDHAVARGFPLSLDRQAGIAILCEGIDPQQSPTFRRGQVGGWREAFTPEHKQLFKSVASDLLVRLGYEQDDAW